MQENPNKKVNKVLGKLNFITDSKGLGKVDIGWTHL